MMEDGSAAAVENILIQGGALGFYQKRLFFCSCFLQALTVSALIYASHCRPDITPPSPPTSTNGARVHQSKCRPRSDVPRSQEGLLRKNETSSTEDPRARNGSVVDGLLGRDRRSAPGGVSVTGPSVVLSSRDASGDYGNVAGAKLDVSTVSVDVDYHDHRSGSTRGVSTQHRHRFPKHDDHGVREKTSVKVTLSILDAVTPTPSSFYDVTARANVYVSPTGFYPVSPTGTQSQQEYVSEASGVRNPSTGDGVEDSAFGSSGLGSTKDKRESSRVREETTDGTANVDVSSSDSVSDGSTVSADVTASSTEDNDCEDEDDEEEGPFHYLSLTYMPAPEWLGDVNNEQLIQYNAYCQAVGAMVGAALGAMGADQAGRRRPLYVYFPLMLIAHCLSGFAVSWTMLAVFRFLVGMFAGACAVVSLVFPLEFIGTERRDACVCSGIWVAGVVLISLELLITRHWRYLAFISGGIGLPLIGTYFIASESARWLLCHQKFSDAEATLKEIVSCNSTSVPDFLSLFDKSRACVVTNMHHKRYTYLDLFHSLEMAKWTFALLYTCLVGSSVYFCLLAKVRAMTGNVYLDNSLPFVIDLPLGWSAIVVNRCLGRRWCLFLYAVASGLALLSVLVLHVTGNLSHMPSMLTGMAVFGKIGVMASLGLVFVIAVEMYPTVVRCMGVAVAVVAVTGGSLLAEALLFLEAYHYTVPFVVFGAMMASVGFAGLLFPETLQRPMPNILPCRHRTIPLHEGVRLVTNPWDAL